MPDTKPLFTLKREFYTSLDAFLREVVELYQMVKKALDLRLVSDPSRKELEEALVRLDALMLSKE